jgi:hypothetical protein
MVGWPREVRIWSRGARSGELGQRWCALLADHGPTRGAGHGTGHISSTLSRGGAWTSPPSAASICGDGVPEVKVELGGEASRYGRQWQAGSCFAAQTSRLHRRGIPTSGDGGGASGSLPFDLSLPACTYGLLRLHCAERRQRAVLWAMSSSSITPFSFSFHLLLLQLCPLDSCNSSWLLCTCMGEDNRSAACLSFGCYLPCPFTSLSSCRCADCLDLGAPW